MKVTQLGNKHGMYSFISECSSAKGDARVDASPRQKPN